MTNPTTTKLKQAYNLIRTGELDQAFEILRELLEADQNLEPAWHMLAFTLIDQNEQIEALEQVLRINPANGKAQTQLEQVRQGTLLTPPQSTKKAKPSAAPRKKKALLYALGGAVALLFLTICVAAIFLFSQSTLFETVGDIAQITPDPEAERAADFQSPTTTTGGDNRAYAPIFAPLTCDFEVPWDTEVDCGYVSVPENRAEDPENTIQLAVAIYRSHSDNPAADPVIYLQGGPGSEAIEWTNEVYFNFIEPLLAERDVIIFDQRGVGLSQPNLDCWEIKSTYLQEPEARSPTELQAAYTDGVQACRDRLANRGADLAAYTTVASAADVKDILTALGYEQANLFGASYGTRLALTIMRDHPQIVRSAILDSVLPLDVKLYNETSAKAEQVLQSLFAACAASADCQAAYPEWETNFVELVQTLNAEPVTIDLYDCCQEKWIEASFDGDKMIEAAIWALNWPEYAALLPKITYDLQAGDYTFAETYLQSTQENLDNDINLGVMFSINCHEQVFTTTPEEMAADLAAHPLTEAWARSGVYNDPDTLFALCEMWPAKPFEPKESEAITSDIPTLIIAGQFDVVTPPSFAGQAAASLSNSYIFELPGQGHTPTVSVGEPCALNLVNRFLKEPAREPNSRCLTADQAAEFVLPYDVSDIFFEPYVNHQYGVSTILPDTWVEAEYGYYYRQHSLLDGAQLAVQADSTPPDEWLGWLTENYSSDGLDQAPEKVGQRTANALSWQLYRSSVDGSVVDFALAETESQTLLVTLVSPKNERDLLHKAIFLPVVEATQLASEEEKEQAQVESDTLGSSGGFCQFVSVEGLAADQGDQIITSGNYLSGDPSGTDFTGEEDFAVLTVVGTANLPETLTIQDQVYTLVDDGTYSETLDPAEVWFEEEDFPMVNLMLYLQTPADIDDTLILPVGDQVYNLQASPFSDSIFENPFVPPSVEAGASGGACTWYN